MKLLLIHADWFAFEAKQRTKVAEEIEDELKSDEVKEVLVAFTAVEKPDAENEEGVIANASKEILAVANQVKAERIMVYPYAHLSPNLSSPEVGVRILKGLAEALAKEGWEVHRSPFGWYKGFKISCKGHPLSELSRNIGAEPRESKAIQAEKKLVSTWFILDPQGNLVPAKGYDFGGYTNLQKFYGYEHAKVRKAPEAPPHIKFMQSHELVDYESASDPGHFRFYPKGKMIKALLEDYVTQRVLEYGGLEVETPIMYDYEHPSLKKYLERFPARQYTIETPQKRVFLRFAACFGQFLMAHDATLSYRHLPLRLYEMTHYSFRVEQRGELSGLRRLRAFTMPDCHALCADLEQAKEELMTRFKLSKDMQEKIGFKMPDELELAIRITKPFWEENKEYVAKLVKDWGKPALVEMWDDQFFYFLMKYELNFVDSMDKAAALTTDQIDVENAKNYGIKYIDHNGQETSPIILHLSPSGAIERVIYALLERESQKQRPMLPLWLSPTQVRFIPVNESMVPECLELAKRLGCRADVDDRDATLGKKIREAEKEWVPFIVIYGEKEKESGLLAVRVRTTGAQENMTAEELGNRVSVETEGYPKRPLPVQMELSKRAAFR
ncbi:MAG: threonine--tRNA ligase [Candidatus Thermoplasmatota archaeon]|nr:threonine--tRNA ligase [Candidatus Thermoplasmatota archaeon]